MPSTQGMLAKSAPASFASHKVHSAALTPVPLSPLGPPSTAAPPQMEEEPLDSLPEAELTALQSVLLTGLAGLRHEPSGVALYAELERSARAQLDLLEQVELDEYSLAELRELAGRVFSPSRLARLIRGAVAENLALALGKPQEWLLVCRSLKHLPTWVLEDEAERAQRLADESEWRRNRGRRPGSGVERPLFGAEGSESGRDAEQTGAASLTSASAQGGWQDPALQLSLLDRVVLEAACPEYERRSEEMDLQRVACNAWYGWLDLSRNAGPMRDRRIIDPASGQRIDRETAKRRVAEIRQHGLAGYIMQPPVFSDEELEALAADRLGGQVSS